MKAALCFIISYDHVLNKEDIWKEWIEPNKDIINVYFHYKDITAIKSQWIKQHALPHSYLVYTDYFHIVPAYLTLMYYGIKHDRQNQWFCFLTDSCVPIISPLKFREMFFENLSYSFLKWRPAWWDTNLVKRANIHLLKQEFRLANSPWFILNRSDAMRCINYSRTNKDIYSLVCRGNVANESIFSIMLYTQHSLKYVKNEDTTATDWTRIITPTSPHLFTDGDETDKMLIDKFMKENKYTIFLRKVDKSFPDEVIQEYINRGTDDTEAMIATKKKVDMLQTKILLTNYYYYSLYIYNKYYLLFLLFLLGSGFAVSAYFFNEFQMLISY